MKPLKPVPYTINAIFFLPILFYYYLHFFKIGCKGKGNCIYIKAKGVEKFKHHKSLFKLLNIYKLAIIMLHEWKE